MLSKKCVEEKFSLLNVWNIKVKCANYQCTPQRRAADPHASQRILYCSVHCTVYTMYEYLYAHLSPTYLAFWFTASVLQINLQWCNVTGNQSNLLFVRYTWEKVCIGYISIIHEYNTVYRQTKYLCIPATSVPCERVFSASGLVVSYERARLSPRF